MSSGIKHVVHVPWLGSKMFKGDKNFSEVIPTGGLISSTSMAGDYSHLLSTFPAPNQTYKDLPAI